MDLLNNEDLDPLMVGNTLQNAKANLQVRVVGTRTTNFFLEDKVAINQIVDCHPAWLWKKKKILG